MICLVSHADAAAVYFESNNTIVLDEASHTIESVRTDISNDTIIGRTGSDYYLNATINSAETHEINHNLDISNCTLYIESGKNVYVRGIIDIDNVTVYNQDPDGNEWKIWGYPNRYSTDGTQTVINSSFYDGSLMLKYRDISISNRNSLIDWCTFTNMTGANINGEYAVRGIVIQNSTFTNCQSDYVTVGAVSITNATTPSTISNAYNLTFIDTPDVNYGALTLQIFNTYSNITIDTNVRIGGKEMYGYTLDHIYHSGYLFLYHSSGYGQEVINLKNSVFDLIDYNANTWLDVLFFNGSLETAGTAIDPLTNSIAYFTNVNIPSASTKYAPGANGTVRNYYLADIQVVDSDNQAIEGAVVTFTANNSTSLNEDYQIVDQNWNNINGVLTLSNGHTPLPSENESGTACLLEYEYNTSRYFNYTVTIPEINEKNILKTGSESSPAQFTRSSNSTVITPLDTWYRENPNEYQNTTTIVMPYADIQKLKVVFQ